MIANPKPATARTHSTTKPCRKFQANSGSTNNEAEHRHQQPSGESRCGRLASAEFSRVVRPIAAAVIGHARESRRPQSFFVDHLQVAFARIDIDRVEFVTYGRRRFAGRCRRLRRRGVRRRLESHLVDSGVIRGGKGDVGPILANDRSQRLLGPVRRLHRDFDSRFATSQRSQQRFADQVLPLVPATLGGEANGFMNQSAGTSDGRATCSTRRRPTSSAARSGRVRSIAR